MDENMNTGQAPEQGMPAEQPPKEGGRSMKAIIIGIVVLIIVVVGGYFAYQQFAGEATPPDAEESESA